MKPDKNPKPDWLKPEPDFQNRQKPDPSPNPTVQNPNPPDPDYLKPGASLFRIIGHKFKPSESKFKNNLTKQ